MMKFRKTLTAAYLLVFIVYSISPIVATMQKGEDLNPGLSVENALAARLMIFDVFDGGDDGQGHSLKASDNNDADILLKKKRTIFSTKILLDVVFCDSLVPDRPLDNYHVRTDDATRPAYFSALHYFVSGVSPPSLS
ncbi:MAG: hypothetical protein AABZ15_13215 [Nitrospirota bacterium]